MIVILFWVFFGLSLASWLIYPLLLAVISLFYTKKVYTNPAEWPDVSVLIAARDEELNIENRINNLLAQDYPGVLEILIGSDSSSDKTEEIVRSFQDSGVILYASNEQAGKPIVIQKLAELAKGEILVFSDADTEFALNTVRELVLPFSDHSVGCVDGSRRNSLNTDSCESVYWKYEKAIKALCSKFGAVLGATGAVFALRREAFVPLASNRADDFELGVMAGIDSRKCVFNPAAVAVEPSPDDEMQFSRMVRITSWMLGSCFLLMGKALSKGRILLFLQLLFHKLLRWFSGVFLILATLSAGLLSGSLPFALVFCSFCFFHASAIIGFLLRNKMPSILLLPYYYWLMNSASLIGIFRAVFQIPVETWERR